MRTEKTIKTMAVKGPVARKTRIFSLLGAILLMSCLLAGLAQAADNGNVPEGGLILESGIGSPGSADGGSVNAGSGDETTGCSYHLIRCYTKDNVDKGTIGAPCFVSWQTWTCEPRSEEDLGACRRKFGKEIAYTMSLSNCLIS